MTWDPSDLVAFVSAELAAAADPAKAVPMAAYLKTDMPFYGVQKAGRVPIMRAVAERFPVTSARQYERAVTALWRLPHREEKYFAIGLAVAYPDYITFRRLRLFRRLIVEGAWWDLVDGVAVSCVGKILHDERAAMGPELDEWIDDADMWVRRSALIAPIKHRSDTDEDQLFAHCLRRAHEKEFFIRKAIGWTLREYAKTSPDAVREFCLQHRDRLSGLSFREATKHLDVA